MKCNKKNLNKSFEKKIGKKINKRNWKKLKNKNKLKKIKKDEMNFLREQFFKKIWGRNFLKEKGEFEGEILMLIGITDTF